MAQDHTDAPGSVDPLLECVRRFLLKIEAYTSSEKQVQGSGLLVDSGKGLGLTCHHTVSDACGPIKVTLWGHEQSWDAELVPGFSSSEHDLATLSIRIPGKVRDHLAETLGSLKVDGSWLGLDEKVIAIGHPIDSVRPLGVPVDASTDTLVVYQYIRFPSRQANAQREPPRLCMVLTGNRYLDLINPGMSGGPVIRRQTGGVCGLVAGREAYDGLPCGYALPARLLDKLGLGHYLKPVQPPPVPVVGRTVPPFDECATLLGQLADSLSRTKPNLAADIRSATTKTLSVGNMMLKGVVKCALDDLARAGRIGEPEKLPVSELCLLLGRSGKLPDAVDNAIRRTHTSGLSDRETRRLLTYALQSLVCLATGT